MSPTDKDMQELNDAIDEHERSSETVSYTLQNAESAVDEKVGQAEQVMDTTMEKIEKYSSIFERLSQKISRLWITIQPMIRMIMKLINKRR